MVITDGDLDYKRQNTIIIEKGFKILTLLKDSTDLSLRWADFYVWNFAGWDYKYDIHH